MLLICSLGYFKAGCFADNKTNRAMEEFYGSKRIQDCMMLTSLKRYRAFGIQYGDECWTGPNAHLYYNKHGPSDTCANEKGGSWSNYVYIIDY